MTITIDATFENGVLRPKMPLMLAEGAEVQVTICRAEDGAEHAPGVAADPLEAVIGICTGGPADGAEHHDKYIYGKFRP